MMTTLPDIRDFGNGFLTVSFLLCCFAAMLSVLTFRLISEKAEKILSWAKRAMFAAILLMVVALAVLVVGFLTDDFSINAVARYSSIPLPNAYKISATWAGPDGSLLFWSAVMFVLFGLWSASTPKDWVRFKAFALFIGAAVCAGFSALLIFVANPFAACPVTVDVGMGLNPLLQNFWMVVHPPLLFIGYSALLIPFVVGIAAVFVKRWDAPEVYNQLRHWLLFGICMLSMGIASGSRWSYLELGWGGYWDWDPVENASLLPWLLSLAALHSLVGTRVSDSFKAWAAIVVPVPFIFCLCATFITRSGLLKSVHSFGDNPIFKALFIFIACCTLLWLVCIIRIVQLNKKEKSISPSLRPYQTFIFGLETNEALFWANATFVLTTLFIAIATFWPVIWRIAIRSTKWPSDLPNLFYNSVTAIFGFFMVFLIGIAALSDLKKISSAAPKVPVMAACSAGFLCFGIVFRFHQQLFFISLACAIFAFSFIAVLIKLALTLNRRKIGSGIAHIGLLLLAFSVLLSSKGQFTRTSLSRGEKMVLGDTELIYVDFDHKTLENVTKAGPVIFARRYGKQARLWPHNSVYPDGKTTSEVAVHTQLLQDIYLTFDGISKEGGVIVTATSRPMMLWLWLSAIFISIGTVIALLESGRQKYE